MRSDVRTPSPREAAPGASRPRRPPIRAIRAAIHGSASAVAMTAAPSAAGASVSPTGAGPGSTPR